MISDKFTSVCMCFHLHNNNIIIYNFLFITPIYYKYLACTNFQSIGSLYNVITSLLANLQNFPDDKMSVYKVLMFLGYNHAAIAGM